MSTPIIKNCCPPIIHLIGNLIKAADILCGKKMWNGRDGECNKVEETRCAKGAFVTPKGHKKY